MKEELDKKLCEAFPNLYKDRDAPMNATAMCWGFPDDGWFDLLWECSEKIEAEILKMPEDQRGSYRASQVKEKFGTLRFYMTSETDAMEEAIRVAEEKSAVTCEVCGGPGNRDRDAGWIKTLCDSCDSARNKEREETMKKYAYQQKEIKDE